MEVFSAIELDLIACDHLRAHIEKTMPRQNRNIYEANNIVDRWILGVVNERIIDADCSVFGHLLDNQEIEADAKMDIECTEKNLFADKAKMIPMSVEWRAVLVQCLRTASTSGALNKHRYSDSKFKSLPHALMEMRYGLFGAPNSTSSNHWGMPRVVYDELYNAGFNHEAFASPLNSRLMGKPGAKWFSAFPNVDKAFGSSGNFIGAAPNPDATIESASRWVCNPPYVESIMRAATTKFFNAIITCERAQLPAPLVVFIMPDWDDCDAVISMREIARRIIPLRKDKHYYENTDEKRIIARFDSVVLIVGGDPEDHKTFDEITGIINLMRI